MPKQEKEIFLFALGKTIQDDVQAEIGIF